jgi:XRE family aerobic/anaerobic benzoate catabolism transcriptional regulator
MPKRSADEPKAANASRIYLARLGERVRKLREAQGVTLKRAAQLSGLSDRFIIEVEKGKANPSLTSIISLARALQTTVTEVLPKDSVRDALGSNGSASELLALLESRPREQVSRVLTCVSAYLEHARGSHIALVGMRGAGKTTVGALLAQGMKAPFYELDELIEKDTGLSLGEIFDLEGESYYRAVEEKVLQRVFKKTPGIIAAGGGLVMNPSSLLLLKLHSFVVWLQASPEALIARVRAARDERPLRAHPHVRSQANFVVDTTNKSAASITKAILDAFRHSENPRAGR